MQYDDKSTLYRSRGIASTHSNAPRYPGQPSSTSSDTSRHIPDFSSRISACLLDYVPYAARRKPSSNVLRRAVKSARTASSRSLRPRCTIPSPRMAAFSSGETVSLLVRVVAKVCGMLVVRCEADGEARLDGACACHVDVE